MTVMGVLLMSLGVWVVLGSRVRSRVTGVAGSTRLIESLGLPVRRDEGNASGRRAISSSAATSPSKLRSLPTCSRRLWLPEHQSMRRFGARRRLPISRLVVILSE